MLIRGARGAEPIYMSGPIALIWQQLRGQEISRENVFEIHTYIALMTIFWNTTKSA